MAKTVQAWTREGTARVVDLDHANSFVRTYLLDIVQDGDLELYRHLRADGRYQAGPAVRMDLFALTLDAQCEPESGRAPARVISALRDQESRNALESSLIRFLPERPRLSWPAGYWTAVYRLWECADGLAVFEWGVGTRMGGFGPAPEGQACFTVATPEEAAEWKRLSHYDSAPEPKADSSDDAPSGRTESTEAPGDHEAETPRPEPSTTAAPTVPKPFACSKAELLRALNRHESATYYLDQLIGAERLVCKPAERPVGNARYLALFTDHVEHARVIDFIVRERAE